MKKEEPPIVVEQVFDRPVSAVWNAITRIDEMRKWYFNNIPDFRAEVGFVTRFAVESGGRSFLHLWKVTEVDPQRKVVCNWKFEGLPGDSFVTFEVSGDEKSARLTVTTRVLEDFPEDIPEFSRESCLGGWTYFIRDRLKAYLDEQGSLGAG
jgi:uncharacterized protein YndB with AHSA1/START domain